MSTLNYLRAAENRNNAFVFNTLLRLKKVGWPTGFEPATTSSTSLDSTIELRPPTGSQGNFSTAARQVWGARMIWKQLWPDHHCLMKADLLNCPWQCHPHLNRLS